MNLVVILRFKLIEGEQTAEISDSFSWYESTIFLFSKILCPISSKMNEEINLGSIHDKLLQLFIILLASYFNSSSSELSPKYSLLFIIINYFSDAFYMHKDTYLFFDYLHNNNKSNNSSIF